MCRQAAAAHAEETEALKQQLLLAQDALEAAYISIRQHTSAHAEETEALKQQLRCAQDALEAAAAEAGRSTEYTQLLAYADVH
jgi:hypothetical protein